jgi:hypothetical protein
MHLGEAVSNTEWRSPNGVCMHHTSQGYYNCINALFMVFGCIYIVLGSLKSSNWPSILPLAQNGTCRIGHWRACERTVLSQMLQATPNFHQASHPTANRAIAGGEPWRIGSPFFSSIRLRTAALRKSVVVVASFTPLEKSVGV